MSVWFADELEWTFDPKKLIPGEPEKLYEDVDKLTKWSDALERIGDDLGNVRTGDWTGKAYDAFHDDFAPQKKRWHRGADALSATAEALRSYADMLAWAQEQAADAIITYHNGDEAGGKTTLASARSKLDAEGQAAAEKFKAQGGSAADAPGWLYWAAQDAQTNTTLTGPELAAAERLRNRKLHHHRFGNPNAPGGGGGGLGPQWAEGSVSAEAKVWGAEAKGHGHALGGDVSGKAGVDLLGVEAGAGYGVQGGTASANASASAYLARASAEGKYEAGPFEASGAAQASVGAEANAAASVGLTGVHANVDAFAGARASAEGHASVAGVGVGGTAEAWAGIGAEANVDFGMHDGKFVIGGEVGAALGVGGKLGASIEIDPEKVSDAVGGAVDAVEDFGGDAVDTITSIF